MQQPWAALLVKLLSDPSELSYDEQPEVPQLKHVDSSTLFDAAKKVVHDQKMAKELQPRFIKMLVGHFPRLMVSPFHAGANVLFWQKQEQKWETGRIVSVTKVTGLKWRAEGTSKPAKGQGSNELSNEELSQALQSKVEFTQAEWDGFGIKGLLAEHFIKSGDEYFKPVEDNKHLVPMKIVHKDQIVEVTKATEVLAQTAYGVGALLLEAAKKGQARLVQGLLAANVSPFYSDRDANTALILAAKAQHADVCKALIDGGCSKDTYNRYRENAFDVAVLAKHEETLKVSIPPYPRHCQHLNLKSTLAKTLILSLPSTGDSSSTVERR